MPETMAGRIEALRTLSKEALWDKYLEAFDGKEPPCGNRDYLWRRIAYRMQEKELGGLSPDAQARIDELGASLDLTPRPPDPQAPQEGAGRRSRRIPAIGNVIQRDYKGQSVEVKVMEGGFEFHGRPFKSLSAIAKEVTGSHWNGYAFFGLAGKP